jgi:Domain of unknown function (DUF4145)
MPPQTRFMELVPLFLDLMKKVVDCCDEDPSVLYEDAIKDEKLRKLCIELNSIAEKLREHEKSAERGYIAPVNEKFSAEWNVYRERWEKPISRVTGFDEHPYIALAIDEIYGDREIQIYAGLTEKEISELEKREILDFFRNLESARNDLEEGSDAYECIDNLAKALVSLWKTTGFDLHGADVRASRAPVPLVPPKVANKITPDAPLSLYQYWNEARNAYILGASMASLAMSRATLEILLRDVHNAQGKKLEEYIQYMKKNSRLSGDIMHRIQKVGDTILHASEVKPSIPGRKAIENPQHVALQVLNELRKLIET